jgi:hypothetical protein
MADTVANPTEPPQNGCPPWCTIADGDPGHDRTDGTGEMVHEKILGSMILGTPYRDGVAVAEGDEVWVELRRTDTAAGPGTPIVVIARHFHDGVAEARTADPDALRACAELLAVGADALRAAD